MKADAWVCLAIVVGNVRFVAESNEAGHADDFWAHALALHAAKLPASGAITDPQAYPLRPELEQFPANPKTPAHSPNTWPNAMLGLLRDIMQRRPDHDCLVRPVFGKQRE